jgi:hypothetical protein
MNKRIINLVEEVGGHRDSFATTFRIVSKEKIITKSVDKNRETLEGSGRNRTSMQVTSPS